MIVDIERLTEKRKVAGLSLQALLKKAKISKTAYYHLLYAESLLPQSVHRLAESLGVAVHELVVFEPRVLARQKLLLTELESIMRKYPEIDRENVWHTLLLMEEEPLQRLNRALRRGG